MIGNKTESCDQKYVFLKTNNIKYFYLLRQFCHSLHSYLPVGFKHTSRNSLLEHPVWKFQPFEVFRIIIFPETGGISKEKNYHKLVVTH